MNHGCFILIIKTQIHHILFRSASIICFGFFFPLIYNCKGCKCSYLHICSHFQPQFPFQLHQSSLSGVPRQEQVSQLWFAQQSSSQGTSCNRRSRSRRRRRTCNRSRNRSFHHSKTFFFTSLIELEKHQRATLNTKKNSGCRVNII